MSDFQTVVVSMINHHGRTMVDRNDILMVLHSVKSRGGSLDDAIGFMEKLRSGADTINVYPGEAGSISVHPNREDLR